MIKIRFFKSAESEMGSRRSPPTNNKHFHALIFQPLRLGAYGTKKNHVNKIFLQLEKINKNKKDGKSQPHFQYEKNPPCSPSISIYVYGQMFRVILPTPLVGVLYWDKFSRFAIRKYHLISGREEST